jgi:hypothetical protein
MLAAITTFSFVKVHCTPLLRHPVLDTGSRFFEMLR